MSSTRWLCPAWPWLMLLCSFPLAAASPLADSFYAPPSNFSALPVGAILRQRELPFALPLTVEAVTGSARQYLLRTTGNMGQPTVTVTTLLSPLAAPRSPALLSYQIAYDSPNPSCAPSVTFGNTTSLTAIVDTTLVAAALSEGWTISLPDHEGVDAAYLCGRQSAYALWDSLRVSQGVVHEKYPTSPLPIALWGYSGGAIASAWALEYHQAYAPDVRLVGAALGGLDPDLNAAYHTVNHGPFAGFAAAGALGMANGYPAFARYLDQELLPSARARFDQLLHQCDVPTDFAFTNIDENFRNGAAFTSDVAWTSTVNDGGILGHREAPSIPLWVYTAVADEFSPVATLDRLVQNYCQRGTVVAYQRNLLGEHLTEAVVGAPRALQWLSRRRDGISPSPGSCSTIDDALGWKSNEWPDADGAAALTAVLQQLK